MTHTFWSNWRTSTPDFSVDASSIVEELGEDACGGDGRGRGGESLPACYNYITSAARSDLLNYVAVAVATATCGVAVATATSAVAVATATCGVATATAGLTTVAVATAPAPDDCISSPSLYCSALIVRAFFCQREMAIPRTQQPKTARVYGRPSPINHILQSHAFGNPSHSHPGGLLALHSAVNVSPLVQLAAEVTASPEHVLYWCAVTSSSQIVPPSLVVVHFASYQHVSCASACRTTVMATAAMKTGGAGPRIVQWLITDHEHRTRWSNMMVHQCGSRRWFAGGWLGGHPRPSGSASCGSGGLCAERHGTRVRPAAFSACCSACYAVRGRRAPPPWLLRCYAAAGGWRLRCAPVALCVCVRQHKTQVSVTSLRPACVVTRQSPMCASCVSAWATPIRDTGWLERSDLSTATVPYGRGCCVEKLWVTFPAGILDC
jgi:hypothetical protein